ncbi:LysE family translocator [Pararhizobium arenae]|uniref:LysE family translocator n=1 Tax=Pararhizobium arenae TaxID=1856850 RepID=UPI0009F8729F|nr:LysE family translocator [Pararhizobium arenae]
MLFEQIAGFHPVGPEIADCFSQFAPTDDDGGRGLLLAGALYIAWIGYTLLRSNIAIAAVEPSARLSHWTSFRRGALTSLMNPKAYLFMLAVYPQFLKPEFGPLLRQVPVMGVMISLTQLAIYGSLAIAAGRSRDVITSSPYATAMLGKGVGLVLVLVAAWTAWQGWNTQIG